MPNTISEYQWANPSQWSLENNQNHERKDIEIHLSLIIIQGKAKKCIYKPKNVQKFQDLK